MKPGKILFVLTLFLQIPASGADFILSSKIHSQYIAGNGAVFHDKPVIQSDLLVSFQNGIYADIWHSSSLRFDNPNLGPDDEIDYLLAWTKSFQLVTLDAGVLYMNFTDLKASRGDGILPYLEISKTPQGKKSLSPYVRIQPAFPIVGNSPKQGYYFGAGFYVYQQTKKSGPEIKHKLSVIYDSGTFGYEKNTIGEYKFELAYQMGKRTKLILPSVSAYIPLSHPSEYDGRKTSVSVGTGLTISF